MSTFIIGYLLFALVVVILCCWAMKLEEQDVTVGELLEMIGISLVPILNVVAFFGFAWEVIKLTKIMYRKLF